ncbi:hypothetical protein IWW34DRAFT_729899 [Fusarium oxysporum f. sp. albedinis]|nr:hypothetical protein IWW34DRAFT_729899 [Fusarium oxysporum f. sp. albedinis]
MRLCPCLYWVSGLLVNPPQDLHGDSSPCWTLPRDIDPQGLGGTSSSHSIQFNTNQESYTDLQPSSNEPMQVVSVWNLNGFSFLQPEPFISHQRSAEDATRESLPHRQHSKPLRSLFTILPSNNATSPQPARYENSPITSPPKPGLFRCAKEDCQHLSFKDERTLKRHHDSKHSGALYVCRCGYPNGRKDVYLKHIDKENCSGKGQFTCICGLATDDIVEHRKHLKGCATGKRGRPKKQNAGQW